MLVNGVDEEFSHKTVTKVKRNVQIFKISVNLQFAKGTESSVPEVPVAAIVGFH